MNRSARQSRFEIQGDYEHRICARPSEMFEGFAAFVFRKGSTSPFSICDEKIRQNSRPKARREIVQPKYRTQAARLSKPTPDDSGPLQMAREARRFISHCLRM
jgi:hypothetical protein